MRTTVLAILLAVSTSPTWGQAFAPLNAIWHYENFCHMPPWYGSCGYFTVEAVRDTVVNGLTATVLEQRNMGVLTPQAEVIVREADNRVYFYENGQFKLLYDFNLNVGDTLTFSIPHNNQYYDFSCGAGPDTSKTAQVLIVSTAMTEVDGQQLKTLHTSSIYHEGPDYVNWELASITERIGSSYGLFGFSATQCLGGFPGHLRCYSDSLISYKAIAEACDFVMGQDEIVRGNSISIYPNPTVSRVLVESSAEDIIGYTVRSMSGQVLLEHQIQSAPRIEIDLSDTPPGIYIVEIHNSRDELVREKIIKCSH